MASWVPALRSNAKGVAARTRELPDLAFPDGQNTKPQVNARRQKYSTLPKFGNGVCVASTRPKEEGRIAIVTNAGRAAVDADRIGAKGFAGRATVSKAPRAHDRCDRRTAKSCGPGARGLCAKCCGEWWPNRAHASAIRKATGAIVHRSPGRARHKP